MKTLLVLRHAAAKADDSAPTDFARPLKRRGQQQALRIGAMVRANGLEFDAILASPAIRVVQTISGISEGAGRDLSPLYDPRIYNASLEALVEIVREADDRFRRIMLVGHNPGLQMLLLHLATGDGDGFYDEVASGFPTAALAELCLAVDRWRDVVAGIGRIVSLARGADPDQPPTLQD